MRFALIVARLAAILKLVTATPLEMTCVPIQRVTQFALMIVPVVREEVVTPQTDHVVMHTKRIVLRAAIGIRVYATKARIYAMVFLAPPTVMITTPAFMAEAVTLPMAIAIMNIKKLVHMAVIQ